MSTEANYSSHDWRKNTDDAIVIDEKNMNYAKVNDCKVSFKNPKSLQKEEVDLLQGLDRWPWLLLNSLQTTACQRLASHLMGEITQQFSMHVRKLQNLEKRALLTKKTLET